MDGKKRIARLRNADKWKKLGFAGFAALRCKRIKSIKKDMMAVLCDPQPVKPAKVKKGVKAVKKVPFLNPFARIDEDAPRNDGKVWDMWRCTWIDPPKPGPFGSAHNMIDALEKKGFKKLGSGHYSTVLAKPGSDKVIKVTRHQDNWIDYVKWASEKGYAGGFAPRVYSWKKFPGNWSWAVMERMERCVDVGYCEDYRDDPSDKSSDYAIIFSLLQHAQNGSMMAEVYCEDLAPGAFSFVKHLRSEMRASDIRGANTMIRKDGSLCFTDPCAGETTITKTRLRSGDFSPSIWRYFIESCY